MQVTVLIGFFLWWDLAIVLWSEQELDLLHIETVVL